MKNERILVVDKDRIVAEGIQRILSSWGQESGHEIVGQVLLLSEIEDVLKNINPKPTVALVGSRLPIMGQGEIAAKKIKELSPEIVVIAFSTEHQRYGDLYWSKIVQGKELVDALTSLEHPKLGGDGGN